MASVLLPLLSVGAAAGIVLLSDLAPATSFAASASANLARSPARVQRDEPLPRGDRQTLRRSPDGLFYATALVRGRPVRFVVDTGASVTVLSPADAARVGAEPDRKMEGGDMDTAGGPAAMQWSKPTNISLAGHAVGHVQAALPQGDIRVSLLGQDVLSRLDSLTLRGDRLTLD